MTAASEVGEPQSFDHLVGLYDELGGLAGGPVTQYLSARLPAGLGSRAVDLGCGTGRHAALLARRFDEVLAVDVSGPRLAFARRYRPLPNIRYEQRTCGR
jgi:trans-aconitate methyltransferase